QPCGVRRTDVARLAWIVAPAPAIRARNRLRVDDDAATCGLVIRHMPSTTRRRASPQPLAASAMRGQTSRWMSRLTCASTPQRAADAQPPPSTALRKTGISDEDRATAKARVIQLADLISRGQSRRK